MQKIISILLIFAGLQSALAQKYPQHDFINPLNIPLATSGTFGEIRGNHFHSGLDFRTEQVIGLPVFAAANGYISRIKISPYGYGKAIYITHPNGYTTVYGHLSGFGLGIAELVKTLQYRAQSFEIDKYFKPNEYVVKQGDTIAFSGNTGSSGGPHLHFEIRNTGSEKPINPLLFGIVMSDKVPPVIHNAAVYPNNAQSVVNKNSSKVELTPNNKPQIVEASGDVYLGVYASDRSLGSVGKNGVFSIELYVNQKLFFKQSVEAISFADTRFSNATFDYATYVDSDKRFQITKILPNNPLGIYKKVQNRGVLHIVKDSIYDINYKVADFAGNTAQFAFQIKGTGDTAATKPKPEQGTLINWDNDKSIIQKEMSIVFDDGTFYDDVVFQYSQKDTSAIDLFSNIHCVHNAKTPVQKDFTLKIKTTVPVPASLYSKLALARIVNNRLSYEGGEYQKDGYVLLKTKNFGNFVVSLDTVAPMVTPQNFTDSMVVSNQKIIAITISDNFSGIRSYAGKLNGEWVLMEYEYKTNSLFYVIDKRLQTGRNTLEVSVSDNKGNRTTKQWLIIKEQNNQSTK